VVVGGDAVTNLLVERARRGEPEAFAALIGERQVAMTRVATAILGDEADVADVLQETLVSLWRELPRLRDVAKFPAWADTILINACRLVLRRRGRARLRQTGLPDDESAGFRLPVHDSPESAIVDRDAFGRAFDTLPADARAVLVLHHLEGQSLARIAAVFEIPEGTVKSRLFAARRDLEQALARERR
jgi:RNA polymerase sigma-70 factor (ECF subfamily)